MEPERGPRPVLVISAILITGILTKLDAAWLGMIVAAILCVLLVGMRHGPQGLQGCPRFRGDGRDFFREVHPRSEPDTMRPTVPRDKSAVEVVAGTPALASRLPNVR